MSTRVFWGEEQVLRKAQELGGCLVLYSGGLDGTYFLAQVAKLPGAVRCVPLVADLGWPAPLEAIAARARALTGDCIVEDAVSLFADEYVAPSIRANALYNGDYPLSASLSRPLLAELAARYARERGLRMVVHTSTVLQNSSVRMTKTLLRLDENLVVGMPSLMHETSRLEKAAFVAGTQVGEIFSDSASKDANLWCEETESADHLDPENGMDPEASYPPPATLPGQRDIALGFQNGLPSSLDGRPMRLCDLIKTLDDLGKSYGLGLFSGLEQCPLGPKRLEVRRASGAALIVAAHRALEMAVLDERTLATKRILELEWTNLASGGEWHSPARRAIDAYMESLSDRVEGTVTLRLAPHRFRVAGLSTPNRNYLSALEESSFSLEEAKGMDSLVSMLLFGETPVGAALEAGSGSAHEVAVQEDETVSVMVTKAL